MIGVFVILAVLSFYYFNKTSQVAFRSLSFFWASSVFFLLPMVLLIARATPYSTSVQFLAAGTFGFASIVAIGYKLISATPWGVSKSSLIVLSAVAGGLIIAEMFNGQSFSPAYLATFAVFIPFSLFSQRQTGEIMDVAGRSIVSLCAGSLAMLALAPELVTTNYSSLDFGLSVTGRFTGPFLHPNAVGTIAALSAALALFTMRGSRRVVSLLILGASVLLSDQRSAWIAFAVAVATPLLLRRRGSLLHWYSATVASTALIFFAIFFAEKTLNQLTMHRTDSVSSREQIYVYLVEQLTEILPFGIGPAGIYNTTHGVFLVPVAHAHNAWLTYTVAGGLVAGVSMIYLFISATTSAYVRGDPKDMSLVLVAASLSLVESPSFTGSNWTLVPVAYLALAAWSVRSTPDGKNLFVGNSVHTTGSLTSRATR